MSLEQLYFEKGPERAHEEPSWRNWEGGERAASYFWFFSITTYYSTSQVCLSSFKALTLDQG